MEGATELFKIKSCKITFKCKIQSFKAVFMLMFENLVRG
jgi:hypothetical protein